MEKITIVARHSARIGKPETIRDVDELLPRSGFRLHIRAQTVKPLKFVLLSRSNAEPVLKRAVNFSL